mgnify:CR=1 FL=1
MPAEVNAEGRAGASNHRADRGADHWHAEHQPGDEAHRRSSPGRLRRTETVLGRA